MKVVRVLDIRKSQNAIPSVKSAVDTPVTGMMSNPDEFSINGWVGCDRDTFSGLALSHGDVLRDITVAQKERRDVAEKLSINIFGFYASINLRHLGFPQHFEILAIERTRNSLVPVFEIILEYLEIPISGSRTPLVITSLGRAGSTYLMGLLSSHPSIAIPPILPYEERIATYFADHFRTTSRYGGYPVGVPRSFGISHRSFPSNEWLYAGNLRKLTSEERSSFMTDVLRVNANNLKRLVDLHYSYLSNRTIEEAPIFAEKMIGAFYTQEILTSVYDKIFEIILVRDFRDSFVSAREFNEKRGYPAFGAERSNTIESWIKGLAQDAHELVSAAQARPNAIVIKYEKLVVNPRNALSNILTTLGISSDADIVESCVGNFERRDTASHRTSATADASVSRWKHDLSPELIELSSREFHNALAHFGYEMT